VKKYLYFLTFCASLLINKAYSQDCYTISASCQTVESRCASTGKILVTVINGSGTYNYRVTGPVTTSYSSSNEITGLPAGTYTVTVKDVINGCIVPLNNVVVTGTYNDPRFQLNKSDITCLNAANGTISLASVQDGRSPFVYTIVSPSVAGVGTANSTGIFNNLSAGQYYIRLTDSCGGIQTRNITILDYNWWIDYVAVTKSGCNDATFNITVKDIRGNVNNGTGSAAFAAYKYAIIRAPGDTIWSNTYTINNVALGNIRSVVVLVQDGCGNIKTTNWVDNLKPGVAAGVNLTNYGCTTFTANIHGQQYLTSPTYCIYDNTNTQLSCNASGVFNNLPYGSYCIEIKDICYDTTITRCFTVNKPKPSVNGLVTFSNVGCNTSDVSVLGQTNLFNPQFCLFDGNNTPLGCNTTGVFTALPTGNYCIEISSPGCYDTTIRRCFSVVRPTYSQSGTVAISNIACATFTASVTGQTGFTTANYCLYDNLNNLITCNATGVFNDLGFGSYCIITSLTAGINSCYDTSFTRCFTVNRPIPSVAANVSISNKTCTTFNASITGQANLTSPMYCLYNGAALISCNTTGVFTGIAYGSYCIEIATGCNDTTIQRCFTVAPDPLSISSHTQMSCTIGGAYIAAYVNSGTPPYQIELYNPSNILIGSQSINSLGVVYFDNLADLPAGQQYTVVVYDGCGNKKTLAVTTVASNIVKNISIIGKCPGGTTVNGSSDIQWSLTSNVGTFTPKIIKKDGTPVNISHSTSNLAQTAYDFDDLVPGTYVIESIANMWCGVKVYDTVTVQPYAYPSLANSSIYQCDNSGFGVNAVVNGGVAPFNYEIIGSVPALPSIVSPAQASPGFNINNGVTYSLVRLRTIDACGNASINDASVMPLANIIVSTQNRCMYNNTTLHVDTIPNAVYTWYKRIWPSDSIQVGNTVDYNIASLTPSDTGTYICKVIVNNGCLVRVSTFNLTGQCMGTLPLENILLTGKKMNDKIQLNWTSLDETDVKEYVIERRINRNQQFSPIAYVAVSNSNGRNMTHMFQDDKPDLSVNYYRIKAIGNTGKIKYSNEINFNNSTTNTIYLYPNPATDMVNVRMNNATQKDIVVRLFDASGKIMIEKKMIIDSNQDITIKRPAGLASGYYFVSITDTKTGVSENRGIIFR
jgi:hypothetical protein